VRPGFDYHDLNKVLKEDGPMHYMPNPDPNDKGPGSVQCKVHEGELSVWIDGMKRGATAKGGQQAGGPPKGSGTGEDLYQKGLAIGYEEGYAKGYQDVKPGEKHRSKPPFDDAATDQYVHGHYMGWTKGYVKGRIDSELGHPQQHGKQE
jgi:hypothetical protein